MPTLQFWNVQARANLFSEAVFVQANASLTELFGDLNCEYTWYLFYFKLVVKCSRNLWVPDRGCALKGQWCTRFVFLYIFSLFWWVKNRRDPHSISPPFEPCPAETCILMDALPPFNPWLSDSHTLIFPPPHFQRLVGVWKVTRVCEGARRQDRNRKLITCRLWLDRRSIDILVDIYTSHHLIGIWRAELYMNCSIMPVKLRRIPQWILR